MLAGTKMEWSKVTDGIVCVYNNKLYTYYRITGRPLLNGNIQVQKAESKKYITSNIVWDNWKLLSKEDCLKIEGVLIERY